MRRASRYIPPVLGALALALTACTTGGGTGTSTPTPSPTVAVACPYGDWSSTQVAATGSAVGITLSLQGGSGVTMTVAQDGATNADFTPMQPITFTAQVANTEARGEFRYLGPVSGMMNVAGTGGAGTGSATSSPSASPGSGASPSPGSVPSESPGSATPTAGPTGGTGTSGPWQPVGQINFADLRATIKVTAPVSATIADNVKLSELTGNQTTQVGNAIDLQPLLRAGQYTCSGDQLTVVLSAGTAPTVTWTFARA
jgi:hypothetical protein